MKLIPPLLGASVVLLLAFPSPLAMAQASGAVPAAAVPGSPGEVVVLSVTEHAYSVSVADADQLLQEVPTDAARFARLREMAATGKAKLERLLLLRTQAGQKAVVQSVYEWRFATEYDPPIAPTVEPEAKGENGEKAAPKPEGPRQTSIITPTGFETRMVGDTLEVTPSVSEDGKTIELLAVPTVVRYAGERTMGGHPMVKQPIFETATLSSLVRVRDGQVQFLGTLSPNFVDSADGKQKEPRVWLDFITVNIVRPEGAGRTVKDPKKIAAMVEKAKSIIIPAIQIQDASIEEGVDFLRRKSVELDPGKKGVNILFKPTAKPGESRLTLNLRDIPLYEALRYMAQMTDMALEADEDALVVLPAKEGR